MEILRTENLVRIYKESDVPVSALKGVDLIVEQGEFIAITGASGSGKSTLLNLLGGLDVPDEGKVILEGRDIYALNDKELSILRRRKFGFVFQFYNLIPVLTGYENIVLPLILDNRKIDTKYIDELIGILGIKDKKNSFPRSMSGGQQQRVSIARALSAKPGIVFADEPTGNLDTKTSGEVLDLIRISQKKYHQTMLIVTHDPVVAKTADRMIVMEDGKILNREVIRR